MSQTTFPKPLEAEVNDIKNKLTPQEIPVTFASNTDSRLLPAASTIKCYRTGNIVYLYAYTRMNFSSTPFAPTQTIEHYINNLPHMIDGYAFSSTFSSGNSINLRLETSEQIGNRVYIRHCGSGNLTSNEQAIIYSFMYITDD